MLNFLVPKAYAAVDIGEKFGPAKAYPDIGSLVNVLLKNSLTIAGIIAFVGIVYSGIKFIQAAGDPKAIDQNKGTFTASIIGLMIILGAYFLVEIAQNILGIKIFNPGF